MKTSTRIAVVTASLLPLALFAAVPSSPPSGGEPGGKFTTYFNNIKNPCPVGTVITGFNSTLSRNCSSFTGFLIPILTATSGSAGQAVTGFNSTTGTPIYGNVASQWSGASPGNIYYNTAGGRVGIGTNSPTVKLDIVGVSAATTLRIANGTQGVGKVLTSDANGITSWNTQWLGTSPGNIYYNGTSNVGIGTSTPTQKLQVVGNVLATGFLYSSDKNLKKDITPLAGSLRKILSLNGYNYAWKSTGKKDIGVIAQEVEIVYPELVHTDTTGVKSVEYANLIAPLIEAIKEQQAEIETLKTQVQELSAR